jgi:hypothetical protein
LFKQVKPLLVDFFLLGLDHFITKL